MSLQFLILTAYDNDGASNLMEYLSGSNPTSDGDSDDDGLNDAWELLNGLNPFNEDTDGDFISDGTEVAYGLNPLNPTDANLDVDMDGLPDVWECLYLGGLPLISGLQHLHPTGDYDMDGRSDLQEFLQGTNPVNAGDADADGDGMPKAWEVAHGLSDSSSADAWLDPDGDGLPNLYEFLSGGDPTQTTVIDVDGDGMSSAFETYHHLSDNEWYDGSVDTDNDGLFNFEEALHALDPFRTHTRGGSVSDYEIVYGVPLGSYEAHSQRQSRSDWDGDGIPDWWEKLVGTNLRVADAESDPDGDGLNNATEWQHKSNPLAADTDGDGMPDGEDPERGTIVLPMGVGPHFHLTRFSSGPYGDYLASRGIIAELRDSATDGAYGNVMSPLFGWVSYSLFANGLTFYHWAYDQTLLVNLVDAAVRATSFNPDGTNRWKPADLKIDTSGQGANGMLHPISAVWLSRPGYGENNWAGIGYYRRDARYFYVNNIAAEENGKVHFLRRHVVIPYLQDVQPASLNDIMEDYEAFTISSELIPVDVGVDLASATIVASNLPRDGDGQVLSALSSVFSRHAIVDQPVIFDIDFVRSGNTEYDEQLDARPGLIYPVAPAEDTPVPICTIRLHDSTIDGQFRVKLSHPSLMLPSGPATFDANESHTLTLTGLPQFVAHAPITITLEYQPPLTTQVPDPPWTEVDHVLLLPVDLDIVHPATGELDEGKQHDQTKGGLVAVKRGDFTKPVRDEPVTELVIRANTAIQGLKWKLKFNGGTNFKLWKDLARTQAVVSEQTEFDPSQDVKLYFEGLKKSGSVGEHNVKLMAVINGSSVEADTVYFTVVEAQVLVQVRYWIREGWIDIPWHPLVNPVPNYAIAGGDRRDNSLEWEPGKGTPPLTTAPGYRVAQEIVIQPFKELNPTGLTPGSRTGSAENRSGITSLFHKPSSVPLWALPWAPGVNELLPTATPTGAVPPPTDRMHIESSRDGDRKGKVRFHGAASDPLVPGAFDIDWDLNIIIDAADPLQLKYEIEGFHDDYPAVEVNMKFDAKDPSPTTTPFTTSPQPYFWLHPLPSDPFALGNGAQIDISPAKKGDVK